MKKKLKVFVKKDCPNCPPAKKLVEELKKEGLPVTVYDIDTTEGLSEATYYGVMGTPAIILTDENDKEIKSWYGEVPLKDEAVRLLTS